MKNLILVLVLVACGSSSTTSQDPDGGDVDGDGSLIGDGGHQPDGSGSGNGYTCTTPPNRQGSCCVFETTNTCGAGLTCLYDFNSDQSTFTSPSQGQGSCYDSSMATLADGATCNVQVTTAGTTGPYCHVGSWCAYDANTAPANNNKGTCRKLCDPLDQAAHGCTEGLTCVGMSYCASAPMWPNCPSATNTHLGFCQ